MSELTQLKDFIDELYEIQTSFRHLQPPVYCTDDEKTEWRYIISRYERELSDTIDKADIELSKESWFE